MFGAKVEIAAREKGVDFELEMIAYLRNSGLPVPEYGGPR
jgi:hypothetical protein